MFIYFEREQAWVEEGQREQERENPKQVLCCQHRARCGLGLTNHKIITWAKMLKSQMLRLSHPGAPSIKKKKINVCSFLRERERLSVSEGGAEREGDTELKASSRIQAPSCQHRAWRRAGTQEPWDHALSPNRPLNQLSHPGALGAASILIL